MCDKSAHPTDHQRLPKPVDLSIIKKANALGINEAKVEFLAKHSEDDVKQGLIDLEIRVASAFPAPVRDPHRYLKASLTGMQNQSLDVQTDTVKVVEEVNDGSAKKAD